MTTTATIHPILETYVAELQRTGKSDNTVKAYRIDLVEFSKWYKLRTSNELDPSAVDSQDILDYRRQLITKNMKTATINRRLKAIRKFFEWATATKVTAINPLEAIHQLLIKEQKQTAPKWLERNQQLALLREVRRSNYPRDYALIQTFLGAGLRISELAALTLEDIQINDRSGWLRVRAGKGTKSREIPLDLKTRQAIEEYKKVRPESSSNRLFLGQRGHINPEGITYLVHKYARRAGLYECTPHTLRHSYAKNLVDARTPLDQVATLLGHESLDTTKIYTKPSRADLEMAVRKAAGEIE